MKPKDADRRNRITHEMLEELGIEKVIVAALQVMREIELIKARENVPLKRITDWIDTLDAKRLLELRKIARTVGEGEPVTIH